MRYAWPHLYKKCIDSHKSILGGQKQKIDRIVLKGVGPGKGRERERERNNEGSSFLTLNSVHSLYLRVFLYCEKKWKIVPCKRKQTLICFHSKCKDTPPPKESHYVSKMMNECSLAPRQQSVGKGGGLCTLCTQLPEPKQAQERSRTRSLCQMRYSHALAPALHSVHYTLLKHTPPSHTSSKQLSVLTRKAPSTG